MTDIEALAEQVSSLRTELAAQRAANAPKPPLTRSELNALPGRDQAAAVRERGVVDDLPVARAELKSGEMRRAEFDKLAPADKVVAARTRPIVD